VLQCVAVCCSVLQCVAVCCSVLQCVAVLHEEQQREVLWSIAVCCSVLQCVAVFGSVLQCGAKGLFSELAYVLQGGKAGGARGGRISDH